MRKAANSTPVTTGDSPFRLRPLTVGQSALFNPLWSFSLPLLLCAVLQYVYADQDWSPFQLFGEPANYSTLLSYLYSALAFGVGYVAVSGLFRAGPDRTSDLVKRRTSGLAVRSIFALNVVSFVAVQIAMRDAGLYQIYSGQVSALEIEEAILASPPGLHGLSLITGFAAVLLWVISRMSGSTSRLATISLGVACLQFLAKGKAQGLLYVIAAYVLVSKEAFPLARLLVGTSALAVIFILTRFIRNVDQDYSLSVGLLRAIVFGVYLGSPIANTNYIQTHVTDFEVPYFLYSHAVPPRLLEKPEALIDVLPDPTSPAGVVGASMASSGLMGLLIYSGVIGLVSGFVYSRAKYSIVYRAFLPFLFVTNVFAVMYNHYANLTFFWVPLLLAHMLTAMSVRERKPRSAL